MWPAIAKWCGCILHDVLSCRPAYTNKIVNAALENVIADDMCLVLQLLIGASTLLRYHPIITALQMQTL